MKIVNHWLQSAFPGAQVHIESLSASGATVEFSARCAAYKSGAHRLPHLVVIEHAINSAVDLKPANLELMLRHYLRLPTAPAVLVLNWMQTRYVTLVIVYDPTCAREPCPRPSPHPPHTAVLANPIYPPCSPIALALPLTL